MSFEITVDRRKGDTVSVAATTGWGTEKPQPSSSAKMVSNLQLGAQTGLLPPVVRWVSPNGRAVLLERPPQVQVMQYYGVKQSQLNRASEVQTYELPLPWILYGFAFDQRYRPALVRMYAMKGPIEGMDTPLFSLPLTNLHRSGEFCLPVQTDWHADTSPWTMAQGIVAGFNQVWSTGFNTDITEQITVAYQQRQPAELFENIPREKKVKASNILKWWERATLAETTKWSWHPSGETVNSLMAYLLSTEQQAFSVSGISMALRTAT